MGERILEYKGRSQAVTAWANELGVRPNTISTRLCRGKSVEEALNPKVNKKHGLSGHRIMFIYSGMKQRCYNKNHKVYKRYGGRGITICQEWLDSRLSFYEWCMDNGYSEHLTIDRIDNDGNYEPNNCRWACDEVQKNNTSSNVIIPYKGEMLSLTQVSRRLGWNPGVLHARYSKGDRGSKLFREPKRCKIGYRILESGKEFECQKDLADFLNIGYSNLCTKLKRTNKIKGFTIEQLESKGLEL